MGELGSHTRVMRPPGVEAGVRAPAAELEAGDSGLRSMASVQGALVMYPIHAYGSDAQKEDWLPARGSGERGGRYGSTEPEHGSNPSAMESTAERDADGYVLNGSKTWITNAPISDLAVVWARSRPPTATPSEASSSRRTATA